MNKQYVARVALAVGKRTVQPGSVVKGVPEATLEHLLSKGFVDEVLPTVNDLKEEAAAKAKAEAEAVAKAEAEAAAKAEAEAAEKAEAEAVAKAEAEAAAQAEQEAKAKTQAAKAKAGKK